MPRIGYARVSTLDQDHDTQKAVFACRVMGRTNLERHLVVGT